MNTIDVLLTYWQPWPNKHGSIKLLSSSTSYNFKSKSTLDDNVITKFCTYCGILVTNISISQNKNDKKKYTITVYFD